MANEFGARMNTGEHTLSKLFMRSAGAILFVTGAGKVWSVFGSARILGYVDPILGLQFRQLFLALGVMEILVALVCLFSRHQAVATTLVAWLATIFLVYRLGLFWMDWRRPCGCLGNLTDALHLSPQTADNIMKVMLAYLLVGSYLLLAKEWYYSKSQPILDEARNELSDPR